MPRRLADHFLHNETASITEEEADLVFNRRLLGSVPLRGATNPALKEEEFDHLEVRPVAKVKLFNLSIPEHLKEYELILHRMVNGWYVKLKDYHHFDESSKTMFVHLEWCQLYKEIPEHLEAVIREEIRHV